MLRSLLDTLKCSALAALLAGASAQVHADTFAIENVTVLPMTAAASPLKQTTVVVRDGRIAAIGPAKSVTVPAQARRIDGTGKWLMPSLSDMHVHFPNERMLDLVARAMGGNGMPGVTLDTADLSAPYVAMGVLQIVNASAMSEDVGRRREIESGRVLGPHMALAAMVDGAKPIWPPGMTRVAANAADGRQVVRDIKAEGYDLVKVYSKLDFDTFSAIVAEARQQGLKVMGHLPARGEGLTEKLFQPGFDLVAHAEEFGWQSKDMSDADIQRYVTAVKRNGTSLVSTLTTNEIIARQARDPSVLQGRPEYKYVHPALYMFWTHNNRYVTSATPERIARLEAVVDFNRRLIRAFVQAGITVLPGTDTIIPGQVAGVALHEELKALVDAGMSKEQVLVAATRQSAEFLGVLADRGTLEQGKRADLLLLDADPLADIVNTRKIAAVIANGRYLPASELKTMLDQLVQRYSTALPAAKSE
jgi:imidazolonepropionase-like amidohydrolase